MNFPSGAAAIVRALYDQHLELARGSDDDRRRLTFMMATTFAAAFGPRWGLKASSKTAPQSKDTIAFDNMDGTFDAFDWQNGTTREPQVRDGQAPTFPRIGDQWFIDVIPHNFLAPPELVIQPVDTVPAKRDEQLERLIEILNTAIASLEMMTRALQVVSDRLLEIKATGVRVHL